jgi:sulfopyruvate decarboxylase alpha subunit
MRAGFRALAVLDRRTLADATGVEKFILLHEQSQELSTRLAWKQAKSFRTVAEGVHTIAAEPGTAGRCAASDRLVAPRCARVACLAKGGETSFARRHPMKAWRHLVLDRGRMVEGPASPDPPLAPPMTGPADWPDAIHRALGELGVRQVAYVPDAGHTRLIELAHADPAMRAVVLTTEEEGVALLAGAWLGGERGALLVQSSGVGNCVNMLSLNRACRLPLLTLVTMRGEWGEFNPWQLAMGQTAAEVLTLAGVIAQRLDEPELAGETVLAAGRIAFEGQTPIAVLIGQRLIGAKSFDRGGGVADGPEAE